MTISESKINLLRVEQGLTVSELSKRSGISRQNISTIVKRGACNPLTAGKLAAGLGVPVAEIIKEG